MRLPPDWGISAIVCFMLALVIFAYVWLSNTFPALGNVFDDIYLYGFVICAGIFLFFLFGGAVFNFLYKPADNIYALLPDRSGKGFHVFTKTINMPSFYGTTHPPHNVNYSYIQDNGRTYARNIFSISSTDITTIQQILASKEWTNVKNKLSKKIGLPLDPVFRKPSSPLKLVAVGSLPDKLDAHTLYFISSEGKNSGSKLLFPNKMNPLKLLGFYAEHDSEYFIDGDRLIVLLKTEFMGIYDYIFAVCVDLKTGKKVWRKLI